MSTLDKLKAEHETRADVSDLVTDAPAGAMRQDAEWLRRTLQQSEIAKDAIEFVRGTGRSLTPAQVTILKALLNKAYPDLKAVEHSGAIETPTRASISERMAAAGLDVDATWRRISAAPADRSGRSGPSESSDAPDALPPPDKIDERDA